MLENHETGAEWIIRLQNDKEVLQAALADAIKRGDDNMKYANSLAEQMKPLLAKQNSKSSVKEKLKEAAKNLENAVGDLPSDSLLVSEARDLIIEAMEMML